MAGTNDFQVFAGASGSNVITQPTYLSLAARTTGFVSGIAQSAQLNKVWRQSSIVASMIAQFIVDNTGASATDDGTTAQLEQNFELALQTITRIKLSSTLNLFVNTATGADTNNGTSQSPTKTIGAALKLGFSAYDYGGNALIINIAAGTYNESVNINGVPLGCSSITLLGNNAAPSSVIISVTNANAVSGAGSTNLALQGVTVQASGTGAVGFGITAILSQISVQNVIFGSCGNAQISAGGNAFVIASGPLTFQGTSGFGVAAESCSSVFLNGINVTFAGGCAYTQSWALATQSGSFNASGVVFAGSFTGTRYNGNFNSSFFVNGAGPTYFPGTVAGILANNAVYA
jgi:hypothetical protein